jgi:hypothetical protein
VCISEALLEKMQKLQAGNHMQQDVDFLLQNALKLTGKHLSRVEPSRTEKVLLLKIFNTSIILICEDYFYGTKSALTNLSIILHLAVLDAFLVSNF